MAPNGALEASSVLSLPKTGIAVSSALRVAADMWQVTEIDKIFDHVPVPRVTEEPGRSGGASRSGWCRLELLVHGLSGVNVSREKKAVAQIATAS